MNTNFTNFFNYAAKEPQNTGGGNSRLSLRSESAQQRVSESETRRVNHAIITQLSRNNHPITLRAIRYVAVLLMVFMVGIGNVWGQTLMYHSGYENGAGTWTISSGSITSSSTVARTGSKSVLMAYNGNSAKNGTQATDVSVSSSSSIYVHIIAWAKAEVENEYDKTTAQLGITSSNKAETTFSSSSWTQLTYKKNSVSASTVMIGKKNASNYRGGVYFDDIVVYYSTNSKTDISYPNAPTAGDPTSTTLSWNNIDDSGDGATGRQATLIWKRKEGCSANDLTLNNQGNYVVPAEGATSDQSGHWTLVTASVAADATSYSGTFTEGDVYAIIHRDLAYNYSTPAYVTIPGSVPSATPTITGAVNEAGWGSVSPASIMVTSGDAVSIDGAVLTCGGKTLTATATTATAEYTYAFVNWTGVANADEITANVTATANFSRTANNYTLAWNKNAEDADDLAGEYTSGTVAYGSDITKPNTPTRDGYDFLGWAETSSGDVVIVPATMPAANKTYYAKWAADPCSEPDKVTNEIARFFVPCGLSNSKGDGSAWTVSDEEASTEDNTFNTYKFGGSLSSSNWYRNTTTGLIYGKLTDNAGYIQIKLKNDKPFKAGDVVHVYCNRDKESKSSVKLHDQSTGNEVTLSSTAAGVEASGSYTLVAADVESDGSLKFFRSSSNTFVNRIIVTREPPCVGDPGDISKGTLSAGVLTLNAAGSPVSGDTWYWQTSATGTDQTNSGTSYGVSAAGTYYVRSYNATGTCWSEAKSFTVTAEDLVENYTVIYKDGTTELKSVTVTVGNAPDAYSPTKDFYTFAAWQKDAADFDPSGLATSAVNGDEITLTARWAGNYAYGTYLFNSLTMGATISKTITEGDVVLYNDAFRVDNFYFAAGIKIEGEIGTAEETTTLTNYKGWKLKINAKTIKFLVENNSQVKVAIGEKTGIQVTYTPLVGAETTASQAKDNETAYSVKGGTVVTITTTSDNTTTLKRLSISNLYNVTYTDGTGDASGSASNVPEVTLPTPTETIVTVESTDYSFTGWEANQAVTVNDVVKSAGTLLNAGDVAVLGANTTFTAQWAVATPKYAITKGTHTNGDFTISVAEQEAGGAVTLTATPNEDYVFSAWDVYKTGESSTKVSVTNNAFTMPAYAVTVDASFVADSRAKVLYVTSNSESDTKASDKVYAALKDTYNVKIVGPSSDADQSGYALVVLHESVTGSNYSATAVAAAKTGNTPVLNTKSYFYNDGRWGWGTPNAGKKTKGVHVNRTYCNITNHPLFNDLTPDANDSIIILSAINDDGKPIQPVGSFTSGKEGYTLANVPDGCAIHELTPAQRGASSGKYLLISLYSKDFGNLNANGQKLFQNAAAYLIGNTAWEPINALTSPAITASPSVAYTVGDNIALTASATGSSAATTYTWYKGDTWAAAEEAGAIQAAATAASNGNKYGVTGCASGDAGTYWCVISNGTGCDAKASLAITVSDVSYDIAFVSAHGTAPTATTGVSYTLPELTASGWEHQGWTASIDVTVDAATVTAGTTIDNGKIATFAADVTFTAVWAEIFDVTFNMQSHGASIAAQHIVDGGKATEPNDPSTIGWNFGGWFTDAECTVGNEFDFNTAITADRPLYAKWTAFDGCTELWPATSGDAPEAVGDAIVMQTGSNGASMTVEAKPDKLSYTVYGLQFGSESGVKVNVVLNNDLTVGTKISLTLVSGGTGGRGLHLYNSAGAVKIATLGWSSATNGAEETFTYTVVAEDGLDDTNAFQLWRNNTVYLKSLKVESCGDAVIYHDLTSAITPDHDPAYATVTLSATSVREGRTATATYSDIAEGMEFEAWEISGTGASIADASANPAVITMGTADAVVTLKVRTETPKHTVSYDMQGHGDAVDSEDVKEGKKVTEPEVAEVEGWIFGGWYKEAGCANAWDFDSDVMGTSNMTLYAKWTEDTSIRLIVSGAINSSKYYTGATMAEGTVTVDGVSRAYAKLGNTASDPKVNALNKVITYNATSTRTKVMVDVYNNATSARQVKIFGAVEGAGTYETLATIDLDNADKKHMKSAYYEFNNDKNRTIYISVPSSVGDVAFLQVKVIESGEALPMFGQIGYSIDFNKGRLVGPSSTDIVFEGMNYNLSSNYQALSGSNISLTKNKSYQFTVPVPTQITIDGSKAQYYVTTTVDGEENSTNQDGAHSFNLAAGTWYLRIGASNMSVKSISFTYPQVEIEGEMDDAALIAGADVVIPNGANLTLSEDHTLHNLDIEAGGKISVAENKTLTVNNLTINSEASKSGQLIGATNVTANAVYMDVTFFKGAETLDETTAGRWYMISAPFDVNLADGFYKTDGTPMVFGQTDGENIFDLFEYDGNKRATTGVTGWKRVQGKMKAGRACLIGFNPGQPTTIRLKAASTVLSEPTSIALNEYAGDDANRNWNGVANPTMHYTDLSCDVQTYNNEDGENGRKYIAYSASNTSFVVGTAFFVQATGTIDLTAASHSEFRAPQRQANERYEACVRISRSEATDFADQMYVRASENASSEYEQGHDMITWNGTTANTALIWAENYGKRLAIEEAPLVNDKASYKLGIFAPVAGEYRIEAANPNDDATLYLTKNGRIFWNLTMGACELDLAQGQNNEYGLLLRAEAPAVTTGMDEIHSEAGVQKVIIDENVFVLRGEKMFDVTGKLVK